MAAVYSDKVSSMLTKIAKHKEVLEMFCEGWIRKRRGVALFVSHCSNIRLKLGRVDFQMLPKCAAWSVKCNEEVRLLAAVAWDILDGLVVQANWKVCRLRGITIATSLHMVDVILVIDWVRINVRRRQSSGVADSTVIAIAMLLGARVTTLQRLDN